MAMQYLAGSKGVYVPSGVNVELAYDTCSESKFVHVRAVDNEDTSGFSYDDSPDIKRILNKKKLVLMKDIRFTEPVTKDFQGK